MGPSAYSDMTRCLTTDATGTRPPYRDPTSIGRIAKSLRSREVHIDGHGADRRRLIGRSPLAGQTSRRALRPPGTVGSQEQPHDRRTRPAHDTPVGARVQRLSQRGLDLRAQRDRGGLQVVVQQLARGRRGRAELERDLQGATLSPPAPASCARPPSSSARAYTAAVDSSAAIGSTSTPNGWLGGGSSRRRSPAPVASQRPGAICAGTSAPRRVASSSISSSEPSPDACRPAAAPPRRPPNRLPVRRPRGCA